MLEQEKTKRTYAICLTVASGILFIASAVVLISGQWAEYAKKKAG
jgi:hypothetical protein